MSIRAGQEAILKDGIIPEDDEIPFADFAKRNNSEGLPGILFRVAAVLVVVPVEIDPGFLATAGDDPGERPFRCQRPAAINFSFDDSANLL